MTITGSTGLIQWTPTNAQVSPPAHSVTVRVTDNEAVPASATQSFMIMVDAAPIGPTTIAFDDFESSDFSGCTACDRCVAVCREAARGAIRLDRVGGGLS